MRDPYSVLGLFPDATDEEVKTAYRNLARKYHPDNYKDDNPLKDLAKEKMQEINAAYDEIQRERASRGERHSDSSHTSSSSATGIYITIRQKINEKKFAEAERLLYGVNEFDRTADWHYLNSICLMKRGRSHDAMRELELACQMDPSNAEYQRAKQIFNTRGAAYGSTYYGDGGRPMTSATVDVCDCCYKLWCLDCICEICGGDLIPCL